MMSSILGSQCPGTAEPKLGSLFTGVSDDVEQQATLLRGWNQTYSQMSAGKFSGSVTEICLGESRIFSEYTGQTLLQSGELPSDLIAIGLPLRMEGPAFFCGMPDHPNALHVFSGRNGFEFFSPTAMVMAGLVVSRDTLSDLLLGEHDDRRMEKFESAHLSWAEPAAAHTMREYVKGVIEISEASPHLLLNGPIMATLYNGLVSNVAALVEASAEADMPVRSIEPNRRWSIVAKAREAIVSRPEQPTSMAELCQILGVSRRTLQYCFQDVLNVNPATFLRAVRLNGVRRMLRTAPSVTEAATFWGFWRFGHFAQDYAALFGELPSQTHRRYHSRPRNA